MLIIYVIYIFILLKIIFRAINCVDPTVKLIRVKFGLVAILVMMFNIIFLGYALYSNTLNDFLDNKLLNEKQEFINPITVYLLVSGAISYVCYKIGLKSERYEKTDILQKSVESARFQKSSQKVGFSISTSNETESLDDETL